MSGMINAERPTGCEERHRNCALLVIENESDDIWAEKADRNGRYKKGYCSWKHNATQEANYHSLNMFEQKGTSPEEQVTDHVGAGRSYEQ